MIGLIYKDLIVAKKQLLIAIAVLGIYGIMAIASKSTMMFGYMCALFCIFIPITGLSYDEKFHWNKYALTMPYTKKQIVYSKYTLSAIILLIADLLFFLASFAIDGSIKETTWIAAELIPCLGLLFLCIYLPVTFKFGVEKSRFVIFGLSALIMIVGLNLDKMDLSLPTEAQFRSLLKILPLIILFILVVSATISTSIIEKKEY